MQNSEQIVESVRTIADPIVRALDLDLVDVEYVGQGSRTFLRVFIDKAGGVSIEDCEQVHVSLGHALDVNDLIPHAYTLEVSSPGLDRAFKRRADYERALGKFVTIKLRSALDGQWRVDGRLLEIGDDGVTLQTSASPEQRLLLHWNMIADARVEITFR
jgi:ribosome maturation factor RimP